MAPLTAAEILAHPAYKAVGYNLTPTSSGHRAVAHNRRGGPFNLYYEIHGTGPTKLVVCTRACSLLPCRLAFH